MTTEKQEIATNKAPEAIGPYSQAVSCGGLIFCSGQIPLNPTTGALVEGDISLETKQVMENLMAVIQEAGSDADKILKTTIFLRDMQDFAQVNKVYAQYFQKPYPARATVQVADLPLGVRVEIDAIAKV